MKNSVYILGLLLLYSLMLCGQPSEKMVRIQVIPDHADWLYQVGEKAKIKIRVFCCGSPMKNVEINYSFSQDMMSPFCEGKKFLKDGEASLELGTMHTPGFLRCMVTANVEGNKYEGMATIGFEPEKIKPTVTCPEDFDFFWEQTKEQQAKGTLNPVMKLLPERCSSEVNVYHVSFNNDFYGYESKIYGILCIPKKPGKYPAVLKLPGAGVSSYYGEPEIAKRGVIVLEIGIHGIPVNLNGNIYTDLYMGPLKGYHSFNLDDKERYYYNRVYMNCVRSIDFIYSLSEFNGNLGTFGGSQGGALSIVTAALDNRVKGLVAFYPALCDMTGYLYGRAGGWPHFLREQKNCTPQRINTVGYYDVVNFARRIEIPGFYTFGYNDMICPPTSVFSAYNVIKAPKTLLIKEDTGHYSYSEQTVQAWNWIIDFLTRCKW